MAPTFPVYPKDDLAKLDAQKRAELRAAILQVFENDPDVKKLLGDTSKLFDLPELRKLLKEKTLPVFDRLSRSP